MLMRVKGPRANALLVALLALQFVVVSGCEEKVEAGPVVPPEQTSGLNVGEFKTRTYSGHRYVVAEGAFAGGYGVSILHDPDCPCGKGASR